MIWLLNVLVSTSWQSSRNCGIYSIRQRAWKLYSVWNDFHIHNPPVCVWCVPLSLSLFPQGATRVKRVKEKKEKLPQIFLNTRGTLEPTIKIYSSIHIVYVLLISLHAIYHTLLGIGSADGWGRVSLFGCITFVESQEAQLGTQACV